MFMVCNVEVQSSIIMFTVTSCFIIETLIRFYLSFKDFNTFIHSAQNYLVSIVVLCYNESRVDLVSFLVRAHSDVFGTECRTELVVDDFPRAAFMQDQQWSPNMIIIKKKRRPWRMSSFR